MIHTQIVNKNLWGNKGEYEIIHYFDDDFPEEEKKYLNKEVEDKNSIGIILGYETNKAMLNDNFMVYFPVLDKWGYYLVNDASFYKEKLKDKEI